jgi:hypothetical protein
MLRFWLIATDSRKISSNLLWEMIPVYSVQILMSTIFFLDFLHTFFHMAYLDLYVLIIMFLSFFVILHMACFIKFPYFDSKYV